MDKFKNIFLTCAVCIFNLSCSDNPKSTDSSRKTDADTKPEVQVAITSLCTFLSTSELNPGDLIPDESVVKFSDNSQATIIGNRIIRFSTSVTDIHFVQDNSSEGKVENAIATVIDNKKYVIYNNNFMNFATLSAKSQNAEISILAHEIGHHILRHTRSTKLNELAADEHSGWVMQKLNVGLDEAQSAIDAIAPMDSSMTHPGKADRLAAIKRGWEAGAAEAANLKITSEILCTDSLNSERCRFEAGKYKALCTMTATPDSLTSISCRKADLYSQIAKAIDRQRSNVRIRNWDEAKQDQKSIDAIKQELAISPLSKSSYPDKCFVRSNGREWNKCFAEDYNLLAYESLINHNLGQAKIYFSYAYGSFPTLGNVDEVNNVILTNKLMTKFSKATLQDRRKIIHQVCQIIITRFPSGIPAKLKPQIVRLGTLDPNV
ncbi:MAG: hypothetical protein ACO1N1_09275 [Dyadobacter fermentans]